MKIIITQFSKHLIAKFSILLFTGMTLLPGYAENAEPLDAKSTPTTETENSRDQNSETETETETETEKADSSSVSTEEEKAKIFRPSEEISEDATIAFPVDI